MYKCCPCNATLHENILINFSINRMWLCKILSFVVIIWIANSHIVLLSSNSFTISMVDKSSFFYCIAIAYWHHLFIWPFILSYITPATIYMAEESERTVEKKSGCIERPRENCDWWHVCWNGKFNSKHFPRCTLTHTHTPINPVQIKHSCWI